MINPQKRAEEIRPKMMKDGKYLIARLEGSNQEKDPEKLIGNYFRWKQYIGYHTPYEEEWLKDSLEKVWSPKYLGLSEDFWSKPIEQVKKLEFQNPALSGAYALNGKHGDPRNYSKVFAVQVSGCDYLCNYCYVPPAINQANPEHGRFFSPKEIVDDFLLVRKKSDTPINVLRITGGEGPTIIPEIVRDIYGELESRGREDVYLWIDTNLSTPKYLEKLEGDLKNIMKRNNVGAVGCFKGVSKEDFSLITGSEPSFHKKQFETAKLLLDWNTDFYVYHPALVYEHNIEKKIRNFSSNLKNLNKDLPLRTEILIVKNYPGAIMNMEKKSKQGRPLPNVDQKAFFDIWHNQVLPSMYSEEMLNKYCCEVPL